MGRYIVVRLVQAVILLFIVSVVTFFLIHSAPGGPAILLNPEISKAEAERIMREMGLLDPIPVQYARWLGNVLQGNLGSSYSQVKPVMSLVVERLPNSVLLATAALGLALLIAIPAGIVSAVKRYSLFDYLVTTISFIGVSVPVFWLGLMLILVFAVNLKLLPAGGMLTPGSSGFDPGDRLRYLVLPALVLSTFTTAELARYMRSGMVTVLGEDYVRTAAAKGLSAQAVLWGHALKNALIPVVTVIGVLIPRLLSSAAVTETVFAWPGLGRLGVEAATTRDYPLVMGITLTVSALVVVSSLLTDIVYAYLDPRIKLHAD